MRRHWNILPILLSLLTSSLALSQVKIHETLTITPGSVSHEQSVDLADRRPVYTLYGGTVWMRMSNFQYYSWWPYDGTPTPEDLQVPNALRSYIDPVTGETKWKFSSCFPNHAWWMYLG